MADACNPFPSQRPGSLRMLSLNCPLLCEFQRIINGAKWRKCHDPISRYTCTIYFTTLKSDDRERFILFSVLVVFAVQVEGVQVGYHTVLNHSVLKNPGPCKGHISKSYCFK